MKIIVRKPFKAIDAFEVDNLPDFVVLTGKNGSGKSHLMEAMTNLTVATVLDDGGKQLTEIKYIPFNGLNPHIDENCEYLGLTNVRKQAWNNVKNLMADYERAKRLSRNLSFRQFVFYDRRRLNLLGKIGELANWDLSCITEELFSNNYEISSGEMFSSQFATIFKLYHVRYIDNKFSKFLNDADGQHNKILTDEEFEKLHGPKPWDLINSMLSRAGLTYQVNHPEGCNKELDFKLHLTDMHTGTEIQVNDLSTGEKVLMSLALSI